MYSHGGLGDTGSVCVWNSGHAREGGGLEPKLERVRGQCSRQSPLVCGYRVGSEWPSRCLASAWSQRPPPGGHRPGFICHAGGRSLGEAEGPGAASESPDGNAPFSASLESHRPAGE